MPHAQLINDAEDVEGVVSKMKSLISSNEITFAKRYYLTIVDYTIQIDEISLKITCTDKEDLEKVDFRLRIFGG